MTAVAASPLISSGKASASGRTTNEFPVELLKATDLAVLAGNLNSRATNAPTNGAKSMKQM